MIVTIEGNVGPKMLSKITNALSDITKGDNLVLYFSSEGGCADTSTAIVDVINKNKDIVSLIFYGQLFSAGMQIFLFTECYKEILEGTRGMYHFAWQSMMISEHGRPTSDYDLFSMREMKETKDENINKLKNKLTAKEIQSISKGKDVYFSYKRMKELL